MVRHFIFFLPVHKILGVFVALCLIWDTGVFSSVFLPQTFETCGVFLADFQPSSNEQGDVVHEILQQLQLSQKISRSLIIKNELAKRDIHPDIFRSMKYDCFLYILVNFGKDLFSTLPSFEDPFQSALYRKALFLMFVNHNPTDMLTGNNWYLHVERQYRIFVDRVKMTPYYNQLREKPFAFYQRYFFCTFCYRGLLQLNPMYTKFLFLKLSNFQKFWSPIYAQHYYLGSNDSEVANEDCRRKNFTNLYRRKPKCYIPPILYQLIVSASGNNFTMTPYVTEYFDYTTIPQIFGKQHAGVFDEAYFQYSSPLLNYNEYPNIIYCLNLGRETRRIIHKSISGLLVELSGGGAFRDWCRKG